VALGHTLAPAQLAGMLLVAVSIASSQVVQRAPATPPSPAALRS
jgi:hypothetical protein